MAENQMPKSAGDTSPPEQEAAAKTGGKFPLAPVLAVVAVVAVVVIGVGGYVGYQMFFSTPSPEQVCEKLRDLMIAEYEKSMEVEEDEAINIVTEILGDLSECIEEEKESREELSSDEVREYTNCIMDAKTFDDLEECDIDR